jgi:glycogen synthase
MKLLIYSHYFVPSIGGVETIVLALATGLVEERTPDGSSNFEVTLVTQTPTGDFPDRGLPFRIVRQPSLAHQRRLIQEADVIHVAGPALSPILLGLLAGKPVVVEHHGFQTICPTGQLFQEPENVPCPGHFMANRHGKCLRCIPHRNRLVSLRLWLLTFLRRFLCQHVAVNIMPTDWLASRLQLVRSETIHHGLPPSPPLVRPRNVPGIPVFVFVGRLVTTKGVATIIEACKILRQQNRPFELHLIGEGPERNSLEALVRESSLTLQAHFLGRVPQLEMAKILERADLVIIPSLGGEVFGMVVAENMLRGISVIASDIGAFLEVLGDGGLTFKTGDASDLARQIARLLDDSSLSNRLAAAAHRRVLELFTLDHMINGHAEIYRRLTSDRRRTT